MGLDMYLRKKMYISNKYAKPEQQLKVVMPEDQSENIFPISPIKNERITEITEEVGYWRKANAIHNWFVTHVQAGKDDCGEYEVSKEQLVELLDTVNKVLEASEMVEGEIQNGTRFTPAAGEQPIMEKGSYIKDPSVAQKLLPAQSGFFFGSTDYDQYYIADLKYTKKTIEDVLKEEGDFYYHSSW